MRTRLGLLFGGASVEHEVSVVSARGVAAGLSPDRYAIVPIGVTGDGAWLAPEDSEPILHGSAARVEAPPGAGHVVAEPGRGLAVARDGALAPLPLDVLFPIVHGWGGEDGRVQGLLDLAGLPCVGPGVLGSSVGMDKEAAKSLFEHRGLPVAPWRSLRREDWRAAPAAAAADLVRRLGLPLFVKPANGGSSVGISRVDREEGLPPALEQAFRHDRKAVVEAGLAVREIEVAVLGNEDPRPSVCGEILPSREFYDYEAKYADGGASRLLIPAPLPEPVAERVRDLAVAAFRALDLAGLARVDFFVERGTDRVWLNEVNTLPGFTPISMYPKLWEATGLPYPDLLDRLVGLARERAQAERARARRRAGAER